MVGTVFLKHIGGRENSLLLSTVLLVAVFICSSGASFQSQAVDPEQFSSQESNMMLEQKAPVFPQQYASQAQMAQGSYNPMQDPNFHSMGQRPNYTTLRMQPRPGLRPTGLVQNQPNQLRLQLQHRLQAQQVSSSWDLQAGDHRWLGLRKNSDGWSSSGTLELS